MLAKKKEVLGCPACYTPLTVDLSAIARQGDFDDEDDGGEGAGNRSRGRGGGGGGRTKRGRAASGSTSKGQKHRKTEEEEEEEEDEPGEEEEEEAAGGGGECVSDDDSSVKKQKTKEMVEENGEKVSQGAGNTGKYSSYDLEALLLRGHDSSRRTGGIMRRVKASEFRSSTKIEALYQVSVGSNTGRGARLPRCRVSGTGFSMEFRLTCCQA